MMRDYYIHHVVSYDDPTQVRHVAGRAYVASATYVAPCYLLRARSRREALEIWGALNGQHVLASTDHDGRDGQVIAECRCGWRSGHEANRKEATLKHVRHVRTTVGRTRNSATEIQFDRMCS